MVAVCSGAPSQTPAHLAVSQGSSARDLCWSWGDAALGVGCAVAESEVPQRREAAGDLGALSALTAPNVWQCLTTLLHSRDAQQGTNLCPPPPTSLAVPAVCHHLAGWDRSRSQVVAVQGAQVCPCLDIRNRRKPASSCAQPVYLSPGTGERQGPISQPSCTPGGRAPAPCLPHRGVRLSEFLPEGACGGAATFSK